MTMMEKKPPKEDDLQGQQNRQGELQFTDDDSHLSDRRARQQAPTPDFRSVDYALLSGK